MRTMLDTVLERGYWISQMLLLITAIVTGYVVWTQYKASKKAERNERFSDILKYLEDPTMRDARRILRKGLLGTSPRPDKWWERDNNDKLEEAAATVCAKHAVAGLLSETDKRLRELIILGWADSIILTHEALTGYLDYRRIESPSAYLAYTRLYNDTKNDTKRLPASTSN